VLKAFRTGVIVAVILCFTVSGGVAAADPPDPGGIEQAAAAADSPDPDHIEQTTDTEDGNWRLHASLDHVRIISVPNMAATASTREAFISATATVSVQALHPDVPTPEHQGAYVRQRSITLFLQQGCQANMGQATVNLNNNGLSQLSGTAATSGPNTMTPIIGAGPIPSYGQSLSAGTIRGKNLAFAKWPNEVPADTAIGDDTHDSAKAPPWVKPGWEGDTLTVGVNNMDITLDGCAGPVSLRFIASAAMTTKRSDYTTAAFGAIVQV